MIRLMIPLLFCIVCFSSCDPGASYSSIVDNKSSHNILVKIIRGGIVQDSILIDAHSNKLISNAGGLGALIVDSNTCSTLNGLVEVSIQKNTLLTVHKDPGNEANWSRKVKRSPFGGGACQCTLIIQDADIQ